MRASDLENNSKIGVEFMGNIDMIEVDRKIGYWQNVLSKIERHMMKEQSERVDIKHRLVHLQFLQKPVEWVV